MNIKLIATLAIIGVLVLCIAGCGIGYANEEAGLRNLIKAKQKDNESEFDNMWKKIQQTAEVPQAERSTLKDLFVQNSQARTTGGSQDGSLMKWVTEAVPQASPDLYKQLMNIITGSRDSWTQRQKELLDFNRKHDDLITKFPSKLFISIFGNATPIEVQIITSTRSTEAMRTGRDDDVDLFKDKK